MSTERSDEDGNHRRIAEFNVIAFREGPIVGTVFVVEPLLFCDVVAADIVELVPARHHVELPGFLHVGDATGGQVNAQNVLAPRDECVCHCHLTSRTRFCNVPTRVRYKSVTPSHVGFVQDCGASQARERGSQVRRLLVAVTTIGLAVLVVVGVVAMRPTSHAPAAGLPATLSASAGTLPDAVYRAGPETTAAYQAAISDPEVLQSVPCLCGCEQSLGHRNNLDCYIAGSKAGQITIYSTHGIDCGVCQTITQIAMNGAKQGLSGPELRQLVLDHYRVKS